MDLAGAIAIDFPSVAARAERKAIDGELARAVGGWPHESTAMNGFGLVQLVARRERPSLPELLRRRTEATARLLLRRAERVREPGVLELSAPGAVKAAMRDEWLAQLARRTGRQITWRVDETLAWHAAFAQAVTP
jgi:Ribonuclease G/E